MPSDYLNRTLVQQAAGDAHSAQQAANQQAAGQYDHAAAAQAVKADIASRQRKAIEELDKAMKRVATPRWLVPDAGVPSIFEYKATPPVPNDRASDQIGRGVRASIPDAVAGCRLGCSCSVHRPAKPAPYIPAIDDWDLLRDV